uniref:Uncharacterized protein n=1 Tax=Anguilla anguilla TaxID=7936 RepID=A0A0E9TB89_ANGAN
MYPVIDYNCTGTLFQSMLYLQQCRGSGGSTVKCRLL